MQFAPSQQPSGQLAAVHDVPPLQTPALHAWPWAESQVWQKLPVLPQAVISVPGLHWPVLMSTQPVHGAQAPLTQVLPELQGAHAAPPLPHFAVFVTVTQVEPLQQPLAHVVGLQTPASALLPPSLLALPPSPPPLLPGVTHLPPNVDVESSNWQLWPPSHATQVDAPEPQLLSLVPCKQVPLESQQPSQLLTLQR